MTGTFFDPHQRATIAAAMARMIPTDDAPGAAEAGTIDFLDVYPDKTGSNADVGDAAADTNDFIESLILSATKWVFPVKFRKSNTIRTARRTSPLSPISTARSVTSSPRSA